MARHRHMPTTRKQKNPPEFRVYFTIDEDAEFEECNGENRSLTEEEYAENEYYKDGKPVPGAIHAHAAVRRALSSAYDARRHARGLEINPDRKFTVRVHRARCTSSCPVDLGNPRGRQYRCKLHADHTGNHVGRHPMEPTWP